MIYRIMDETGSEIARVEGDTVATHAVVVVNTPEMIEGAIRDRIQSEFKAHGIRAIILCGAPVTVTQVFLPVEEE